MKKILKLPYCFLKGITKLILFALILIIFAFGYFAGIILAIGGYKHGNKDAIDMISEFLSNLLNKLIDW